jgi:hypothetical protein
MSEGLLQLNFFRNFTVLDWTGWAFLMLSTLSGWSVLSLPNHLTATLSLTGFVILGASAAISYLSKNK